MPFFLGSKNLKNSGKLKVCCDLFQVGWKVTDIWCRYQRVNSYVTFVFHILGWFVLGPPTLTSHMLLILTGKTLCSMCSLTSPDLLWKGNLLLLLWLQCMAPGMSGPHGACALPHVEEGTGTGPGHANPHNLVGTPARAQRSKPSSATLHFAQVRQLEIQSLHSAGLSVSEDAHTWSPSSGSVDASAEWVHSLHCPKEDL